MDDISVEYISRKNTVLDVVLNGIADGVYIVDVKRKIIFWNEGAEILTGYKSEEVLGYRCSEDILKHIDENGEPLGIDTCPLELALTQGTSTIIKIFPQHKNGKRFPVMAHISPIRNKDDQIIAAVEVFRDISKEENLRILQEKFNNIIKRYVSYATVERVMAQVLSGNDARSRKSDLTILYLDVVQFTTLSEKYPPEEVAQRLNEIFGICESVIKEFYGDIDKFIGDALMAEFVDANDAVRAAEKILESLGELNRRYIQEGREVINVRIALNSGNVVQAEIGTPARKELTVIGDVVNTTVRIEKLAVPNTVFVTESTLSRLHDTKGFLFDRRILVKGKTEPVSIYSLMKASKKSSVHEKKIKI
ncbi:MAG: adenylate/guanylate cyclase domain-containing protein [Bacteroidota bacterium]|jgi:PAS domain S-box-containing protein|nr:PAS domain-containing protein [Ignavibacteria bacterium]MCU7498076.1 PAS domain-containing protein [Ignavibacteria bacterium]MCU7512100.1 PAS domain-containing protein [Ignavibacteria bacterium]MCU7520405.1 PAS domain-containing protein [Ignavibacteria bacterium]MCU7523914.1 PAS domain-containing protein [Ignavibacteria bacterium]